MIVVEFFQMGFFAEAGPVQVFVSNHVSFCLSRNVVLLFWKVYADLLDYNFYYAPEIGDYGTTKAISLLIVHLGTPN